MTPLSPTSHPARAHRMPGILLSILALLLTAARAATPDPAPQVRKVPRTMKTRPDAPPPAVERIPDAIAPQWIRLQKSQAQTRAFIIGDRRRVDAGKLTASDFIPVYPPDILAALGLATVYKPETAGWFLIAGRRLHVRSTDSERQYVTLSYESMARVAWAVGISSQTQTSARLFYESGMHVPMPLGDLLLQSVSEAPATGAWIVAGQARFATLRGRALRRSPLDGQALAPPATPEDDNETFFSSVEDKEQSALIVALFVDNRTTASLHTGEISRRFFGNHPEERIGPFLVRIHYAAFADPAPKIDPAVPFQSIWADPAPGHTLPQIRVVRQALPGSTVRRAHVSVWAIGSIGLFNLYPEQEFVDIHDLDPSIRVDQKWATDATFVGEPIYDKPRLLLRKPVAEAIVRINDRLRERGLQLILYDGYRPLSVTQHLWSLRPDRRYLAVPNVGSRHNRGAALDLTLADAEGHELEMPSPYLTFDERSHRDRPDITERARQNMNTLTAAMAKEGFTGIREEWWHYDAPGWRNYRVADIPLWPETQTSTPTQRNTSPLHDDSPTSPSRTHPKIDTPTSPTLAPPPSAALSALPPAGRSLRATSATTRTLPSAGMHAGATRTQNPLIFIALGLAALILLGTVLRNRTDR